MTDMFNILILPMDVPVPQLPQDSHNRFAWDEGCGTHFGGDGAEVDGKQPGRANLQHGVDATGWQVVWDNTSLDLHAGPTWQKGKVDQGDPLRVHEDV